MACPSGLPALLACLACIGSQATVFEAHGADRGVPDFSSDDFAALSMPPDISGTATAGEADGAGRLQAMLRAVVTDACGVLADEVSVEITEITGNATLDTPKLRAVQLDPLTVELSVAVKVADPAGRPAGVRFSVTAVDNCGLRSTRHFLVLYGND